MNFKDFPKLLISDSPIEASDELINFRKPDTDWISQTPELCDYNDFELKENQNRYTINHSGVPFECLFLPHKNKSLYVLLSGGGTNTRRYPSFIRWKYSKYLNGNVLCIDDPMYYFHPEYTKVQWYYGTKDQSYLYLLIDIVQRFMQKLSIKAENLVFIGSSGGGYASIYCANLIDNSSAIAINPQSILKDWQYPIIYDNFKKIGIDLVCDDQFNRNVLKITNKTSRFIIAFNANSRKEYSLQFTPFFQNHNLNPKYGITQKDNIVTWFHATDYTQPHSAVLTKPEICFAVYLLEKLKNNEDINELTNISFIANEILYEKYELKTMLEASNDENKTLYDFLTPYINQIVEETILRSIPMSASTDVRKLLDYQFEPQTHIIKKGNITYFIGNQRIYRYNLFFYKNDFYFRIKFDKFRDYFPNYQDIISYVNSLRKKKFTNCFFEKESTLVISRLLNPQNVKHQIDEFIKETLHILNDNLKIQ